GADQFRHQEGLLVGAARGGDTADRARSIFSLDALELGGGVIDRLLPRNLAPRIGNLGADHRLQDAILMGGVTEGKAALDAGMAAVRFAVLPWHHAHQLLATHLGLEGATDTAISTGRDD